MGSARGYSLNELQSEDKRRKRRQWAEQAINMAMSEQWQQAIEVNRRIIDELGADVEAWNRLGKAYAQLGHIADARSVYEATLRIDPTNTIAQRNIQRLSSLDDEAPQAVGEEGRKVDPAFFIEETGKTVVTAVFCDAPKETLALVSAGDLLGMRKEGDVMAVTTRGGEHLGPLDGKLSTRLAELQLGGNVYAVAAVAVDPTKRQLRVLVREMRQSPQLSGRVSFPPETSTRERAYIRGGMLREDRADDDDDDTADDADALLGDDEDTTTDALDFSEDIGE